MKRYYINSFIIAALLLSSCEELPLGSDCLKDNFLVKPNFSQGISKETINLSSEDASLVALTFINSKPKTRSNERYHNIRNVVPVNDSDKEVAFYAVNFEDGYVIVSATKHYVPILAFVPCGRFNGISHKTGAEVLFEEYIDCIKESKKHPITDEIKELWSLYEADSYKNYIMTRSNPAYDSMMQYWISLWNQEGSTWHYLNNPPSDMPTDIYEDFCDRAADYDREDYDYMQYSVITKRTYPVIQTVGPLLQTHWDQGDPYNSSTGNPPILLGCVTIATGQLMRYYEYPTSISWNSMPNNTSNDYLADFLYDLKQDLLVNSYGGLDEVAYFYLLLKGYSGSLISHSLSSVYSSLFKWQPVYMSGHVGNLFSSGHAWVCDGYQNYNVYTEYKLYAMAIDGSMDMELIDTQTSMDFTYTHFHMNWGWGGTDDGYYYDNVANNAIPYTSNRKEIIITNPKKRPDLW